MIVDLFAGAGGWDIGARVAGLPDPMGIELDATACATRRHNGLPTVQGSVTNITPSDYAGTEGLIASPPCPDFSVAKHGREGLEGATGALTLTVPLWVDALKPRWVACEQVPDVLPLWRRYAIDMEQAGYRTWTGVVDAADYGVPQNRERAILLANRDRQPVLEPTHTQRHVAGPSLFDGCEPFVPMRSVLDVPDHWVLHNLSGAGMVERFGERPGRTVDQPSFPVRAWKDARMEWRVDGEKVSRFTEAQAAAIQTFPADFEFTGSLTRQGVQIGNAVPPLLAQRLLEAVT